MKKSFFFLYFLTSILFSSCQFGRILYYNAPSIKDHAIFPSRSWQASHDAFQFPVAEPGRFPKAANGIPFETYLEKNKTVAFIIIHRDSIQYEKYFDGYTRESPVASFSMAKSILSILIGCAVDEGLIQSVEDPVTKYIPELTAQGFDKVTVLHLLQMTSGLDFKESYSNPFGKAARFYYGNDLRKEMSKLKLKEDPGVHFEYLSGNSQLLGWVLERALQGKTISDYAAEKLWAPLGMQYKASWSLDQKTNGLEKTFCCLNATAIDYAKIGRLYKNGGDWNGHRVVSKSWVETSTALDRSKGSSAIYQYHWWLPTPGEDFMAQGILGQYIYVHPAKDLIIVRLGEKDGKADWWTVFKSLSQVY